MRIAISQPTYLPWVGYFDLADQVDGFVLLDNVQFEKRSWQQRNRIKTPNGLSWLTVPVAVHGRYEQLIKDAEISETRFAHKHLRALETNYARAQCLSTYFPRVSAILSECPPGGRLLDLNLSLLRWLMEVLGVRTPLTLASELGQEGKRTELLANICRRMGAKQYVSPLGSAAYLLEEMKIMTDCGVDVVFQNYEHPTYRQLFPPFVPYACVLDLIFNEGDCSMEIIRSGRRDPLLPRDVAARAAETQKA